MRILVTGGAGFIGSNFIRHMLFTHPEHTILNLDKLTYAGNPENLKDIEKQPNYTFIKGDICNAGLIESIDFDAIINFAAESHVDRSILNSYPFIQTNISGTQNLLEAAKKRRCRMLHISTDEVYGSSDEGLFDEKSTLQPNSPYAASKASSDLLVRAYHMTFGMDLVITRCSNNYGPFQFPEKLMPLVISSALEGRPIPVYAKGENIRDWIHVHDHCRAVDTVFHKAKAGSLYNIGARNERRNIDIVRLLLSIVSDMTGTDIGILNKLVTFVEDRPGHDKRYAIDNSKICTELGWQPEVDFNSGLRQTVEWYLTNRSWWQRIKSGQYMDYYNAQYGERLEQ